MAKTIGRIMDKQFHHRHRVRGVMPVVAMLLPLAGISTGCSDAAGSNPTAVVPSAPASYGRNVSGSNQRILFASNRDNDTELYSIKPDGTGATRLTNSPGIDFLGVWSPDGKRIAFMSLRDNRLGDIYVMNADGSNVVRLTRDQGSNQEPSWSKGGNQIVFTSTRDTDPTSSEGDDLEVYVMNADGSGATRLTNNATREATPVFSPDGRHIAFVSSRDHPGTDKTELYLMDVDGTHVTRLTQFPDVRVQHPSWDPRSRRLAFAVTVAAAPGIYTLNVDDLGLTRITFGPDDQDFDPTWSADGSQLAFMSVRDGDIALFVMNADGSNPTRISASPSFDFFPRWSR
jgi:TolB protein